MKRYDYREAIKKDIRKFIKVNMWYTLIPSKDKDELYMYLFDAMWAEDSVTGNRSGSYYCNAWKAEEAICHNVDLYQEACEEFGISRTPFKGAEAADVTIRCYLLGECLAEVLDEIYESEDKDHEE